MANLIELVGESKALNSKLFSLPRLLILSALELLREGDHITFRDLKNGLKLSDGALYSNINVLIESGFVKEEDVKLEKETLSGYSITPAGRAELRLVRAWMAKWVGDTHEKPG